MNGKKVCGILAETVIRGSSLKGIVLGIGINLNASAESLEEIDRPATSINIELKAKIDKQEFMANLIESFFENYDQFLKNGFKSIKNDYEKRASFLNQQLKVSVFNIIKEGLSKRLDDDGALILIDKTGKEEKINMGEII